jgi:hypothetical protein
MSVFNERRVRHHAAGVAAAIILTLGVSASVSVIAQNRNKDPEITGVVYDIDFLGKRTQILIETKGKQNGPLVTANPILQNVLQSALARRLTVTATHNPQSEITSVTVAGQYPPTIPVDPQLDVAWLVNRLSCDDKGQCAAHLSQAKQPAQTMDARTSNPQALGVLLTGVAHALPVGYLTVSEGQITRVKIRPLPAK